MNLPDKAEKLTISIIDHDGQIEDRLITPNRRTNLENKIVTLGFEVDSHPFVWGEKWYQNPSCSNIEFVTPRDINFIHSNNDCSYELIQHILNKYPDSWVVEYSGGGLYTMGNRKPLAPKHCMYPHDVGTDANFRNIEVFLKAVEDEREDACRCFDGYDPILEAKLELLHSCLTPPKEKELSRIEQLKNKIETDGNILFSDFQIKAIWEEDQEAFVGSFDDSIATLSSEHDCFSPKYIAILSEIRNKLLTE